MKEKLYKIFHNGEFIADVFLSGDLGDYVVIVPELDSAYSLQEVDGKIDLKRLKMINVGVIKSIPNDEGNVTFPMSLTGVGFAPKHFTIRKKGDE